jgi:hypothetical protein
MRGVREDVVLEVIINDHAAFAFEVQGCNDCVVGKPDDLPMP